jgi:hypothetical protein
MLDENSANSCHARFPEVNAPLAEFVPKMEGVIPVPRFYRTLLAGEEVWIPAQGPVSGSALLTLGLIGLIGAGAAAAPAPDFAQIIPLANGELLILP